jgi:hypothetical protein
MKSFILAALALAFSASATPVDNADVVAKYAPMVAERLLNPQAFMNDDTNYCYKVLNTNHWECNLQVKLYKGPSYNVYHRVLKQVVNAKSHSRFHFQFPTTKLDVVVMNVFSKANGYYVDAGEGCDSVPWEKNMTLGAFMNLPNEGIRKHIGFLNKYHEEHNNKPCVRVTWHGPGGMETPDAGTMKGLIVSAKLSK